MFNGRFLIVSDRPEVVQDLRSSIGAGGHVCLAVNDGREALAALDEGSIPDVLISDLGSEHALDEIEYLNRFRQLNQLGQHVVVVEPGAPFSRTATWGGGGYWEGRVQTITRPFQPEQVRASLEQVLERMQDDLGALRGEMLRERARLRRTIRDVQREMVQALALTVAARDPFMAGHTTRVAGLALRIAEDLNLDGEERDLLENAALLHEIGKVAIPVDLLHKTEKLNETELAQIRSHAAVGAEIVRGVASLKKVAPVIEYQHTDHGELSRHISPDSREFLLAGILRVVDAYDAMTSERSYRGAMPRTYWERELRNGAGVRFHPQAVEALLRVCR